MNTTTTTDYITDIDSESDSEDEVDIEPQWKDTDFSHRLVSSNEEQLSRNIIKWVRIIEYNYINRFRVDGKRRVKPKLESKSPRPVFGLYGISPLLWKKGLRSYDFSAL